MTQRTDIRVDWSFSPRIIMVDAPSVDVKIPDLHDTLRNIEARSPNSDDRSIIDTAGGEGLLGGSTVAFTSTLNNAVVGFQTRNSPVSTGSATADDTTGQFLTDTGADFVSDSVSPGATVINWDDRSTATVLRVVSANVLQTEKLAEGTTNQWGIGDDYSVFNTVQCVVSEGNISAVNDLGSSISPVFPTAFTQVLVAASSSATMFNFDTFLAAMNRLLGLSHENSFLDNTVFDTYNQLTSARLRCFSSKDYADAATDGGSETAGLLATYTITAVYEGEGRLRDYRMTLEP